MWELTHKQISSQFEKERQVNSCEYLVQGSGATELLACTGAIRHARSTGACAQKLVPVNTQIGATEISQSQSHRIPTV